MEPVTESTELIEVPETSELAKRTLEETTQEILKINRDFLSPMAASFAFEPAQETAETRGKPHVLFLGNHSSGKSTFINHLCGREVQKTGLAPTDDGFTVIVSGERDSEKDGEAVISNPELPYQSLRSFGPSLVSHLRVKIVAEDFLRNITLVDSPGMIDSVRREDQRGYDFKGAVKWFAERSDLVLMFFDPDKPGTTGETMHILAEALQGMDHKLLIVLNKVDRFDGIRDFARAYGALCWNLARVIKTKDLPHIYTTFIPGKNRTPAIPLEDFSNARDELVLEIQRTPERRAENVISKLDDFARRLRIHSEVIDQVVKRFRAYRSAQVRLAALAGLVGTALTIGAFLFELAVWLPWVLLAVTVLSTGAFGELGRRRTHRHGESLLRDLPDIFEQLHHQEFGLRERTEDLKSLWERTRQQTLKALTTIGVGKLPRLKNRERKALTKLIEDRVPSMRSQLHHSI